MTRTAFNRDNVLTDEERAASARKCLELLNDVDSDRLRANEHDFIVKQKADAKGYGYSPSERQLAWLRDLVSRYIA